MRMKRTLLMFFCLLAAMVVGGMLASLVEGVGFLSWLAYSRQIGFNPEAPLVLDLGIFSFTFGFVIDLSVMQVLAIAGAVALYNKVKTRL